MKSFVFYILYILGFLFDFPIIQQPPHIIIIVADDLGWNDFGFHGSNQIPTPNIDSLAYHGVILDKFYTQQSCTPSRAALLTGNYPIRSGLQGLPIKGGENRSIPLEMKILPEHLKRFGYSTNLIGKWHLGYGKKRFTPTERGFDYHYGYWNGFCGYFDYFLKQEMPQGFPAFDGFDLHQNFIPQWNEIGKYATDLFTEKSLEVIDNHNSNHQPLFLMIAHLAGHTGKNGVELGVPNITSTNLKFNYINNENRRRLAQIVNLMDESVGKVIAKLSEKKMLENSIILFFSDNGGQTEGLYENYASNWPFRGLKFTLYEGGVRGSAMMYSPLLQKKNYINKELIHISDILPTLYEAIGGNLNDLGKIDGISQWSSISDNKKTNRNEILLNIEEVEQSHGILGYNGQYKLLNGTYRNGLYDYYYGDSGRTPQVPPYNIEEIVNSPVSKAIEATTSAKIDENLIKSLRSSLEIGNCRKDQPKLICTDFCLFDIKNDPCETGNIISAKPDIANDLKNKLQKYFDEIVPQTNKPVDVNSDPKKFNNTWYTWLEINS